MLYKSGSMLKLFCVIIFLYFCLSMLESQQREAFKYHYKEQEGLWS